MKLEKLLGSEITDCTCGKVHRIPTRETHLQSGSINDLPQVVDRHFTDGSIVCAADANSWAAVGEKAVGMLRDCGRRVDVHRVDQHSQPAHADRKTVEELVIL